MPIYFGLDESGNNNNWTSFNFSEGGTAETDSMVDVPTNWGGDSVDSGGEVRGNYAVLSSGNVYSNSSGVLSNGNLTTTGRSSSDNAIASLQMPSGKWYMEFTIGAIGAPSTNLTWVGCQDVNGFTGNGSAYNNSGQIAFNGNISNFATFTAGDIIGCAFDIDNNTSTYFKNGSQIATGTLGVTSKIYVPWVQTNTLNDQIFANFGQRPFAYTPPTGFKSLNTKNLNEQSPFLTGPDLIWIKRRDSAGGSSVHDTVRGITRHLTTNSTDPEYNEVTGGGITSVSSNGFTIGIQNVGPGDTNASGGTYTAWCWNAGNRTITNLDGTNTSTVRANPTTGFSIVTYSGTGSAATIGHGLAAEPKMIIVKARNASGQDWLAYHSNANSSPATGVMTLSATSAFFANSIFWNNTPPTPTVFSVGTSDATNKSASTYVSYCWSEIPGYSRFGSYTGNANNSGPFIYCGFKPRWIMIKRTNATGNWTVIDTARYAANTSGPDNPLRPNTSDAETGGADRFALGDILSNGFKLRYFDSSTNASGGTYIYAAFAEMPFRYGLAR
jgi:hypothetical protein